MDRSINFKLQDDEGRTPLHYAAANNFQFLVEELLDAGADPNIQDNKGFTPFTVQLVEQTHTVNEESIQCYIKAKANLSLRFNILYHDEEVEHNPLTFAVAKRIKNFELFKIIINNGVSVNETDENGLTPLAHAIKVNSKKMVKFFLNFAETDKKQKDTDGKTPIHHVIQPMTYASYENEEILALLVKEGFDINATDLKGKAPIFYAKHQDSGVMANKLVELGAEDKVPQSSINRAATSVIDKVNWNEEVDYEEDAEKFMEKVKETEKQVMVAEEKCPVDDCVPDAY